MEVDSEGETSIHDEDTPSPSTCSIKSKPEDGKQSRSGLLQTESSQYRAAEQQLKSCSDSTDGLFEAISPSASRDDSEIYSHRDSVQRMTPNSDNKGEF